MDLCSKSFDHKYAYMHDIYRGPLNLLLEYSSTPSTSTNTVMRFALLFEEREARYLVLGPRTEFASAFFQA